MLLDEIDSCTVHFLVKAIFFRQNSFVYIRDTLSKFPDGHPNLHQGLKLNSKVLVEKYYKN